MTDAKEQETYTQEYAAVFAPRTHAFETVDIRTPASAVNLRTLFPASASAVKSFRRATAVLALVLGIAVAAVSFASDQLTRALFFGIYQAANVWLRHPNASTGSGTESLPRSTNFPAALSIFVLCGTISASIASVMVVYIAPLGASSGIPQIKAYLNGVRVPGFLSMKTCIVKAVGIGLSAGGGLISGRQGAVGHVGAIIGAGMSQSASTQLGFRIFRKGLLYPTFRALRTEEWKHNFAAIGAAIGVATTFSAPMGGWMWIYEEACTHWNWSLGVLALIGCISGVTLMSILRYLSYGLPGGGFRQFELTEFGSLVNEGSSVGFSHFLFKDIPGYIALGLIGGVVGSILPLVNKQVMLIRYKYSASPLSRVGEVAVVVALSNLLRMLIPYVANDCRPVSSEIQLVLDTVQEQEFSRFNCPDGYYSPWAVVVYNPLQVVVKLALYLPGGKDTLPTAPLIGGVFYYYFFVLWSFGLPVPAGVFLPSFAIGSLYGRAMGNIVQSLLPKRTDVSVEGYAFLGVVSALSGVSRGISVSVIALEATGSLDAAYGAVLVSLVAKLVGDFIHKASIYTVHTELKDMPYLSDVLPNPDMYYKIRVAEVMSTNVIALQSQSRVDEVIHVLSTSPHNSYPVFGKQQVKFYKPTANTNGIHLANRVKQSTSRYSLAEILETGVHRGDKKPVQTPELALTHSPEQQRDLLCRAVQNRTVFDKQTTLPEDCNELDSTDSSSSSSSLRRRSTKIVVPDGASDFVATIYEDGMTRQVTFDDRLQTRSRVTSVRQETNADDDDGLENQSSDVLDISRHGDDIVEVTMPEFSLLGMIDRATLLALLEATVHKHIESVQRQSISESVEGDIESGLGDSFGDSGTKSDDSVERVNQIVNSRAAGISRDWIDAAWPNSHRPKDSKALLERAKNANIGQALIDMSDFLDPDPLLIADQATAAAAYMLFRSTGARHILVTNMREGRIGGIVTRKDVLPRSIREILDAASGPKS